MLELAGFLELWRTAPSEGRLTRHIALSELLHVEGGLLWVDTRLLTDERNLLVEFIWRYADPVLFLGVPGK